MGAITMKKQYIPGIGILGDTKRYPVTEQISMLKRVGWGGFFTDWNSNATTERANAAERFGMIYQSIHAPFVGCDRMWRVGDAGREYTQMLINCVKDCAEHHIPVMVIHPFIGFDAPTPTNVGIENYARVVDVADQLGVTLGFENVEGEEYLATLMEAFADSPACGFCLDTGHEMCYNDGKDMLSKYGDRLIATHINDNLGTRSFEGKLTWHDDLHLLPFDGIKDWDAAAKRIADSGYEGPLTFELSKASKPGRLDNLKYEKLSFEEREASLYKGFNFKYKDSDIEKIAPQMAIHLIGKGIKIDLLTVADNSRHNTDYICIGNSVFSLGIMITADDVIIFSHLKYAMKNVLTVLSDIERTVESL